LRLGCYECEEDDERGKDGERLGGGLGALLDASQPRQEIRPATSTAELEEGNVKVDFKLNYWWLVVDLRVIEVHPCKSAPNTRWRLGPIKPQASLHNPLHFAPLFAL
jgi:hypothetical protein